MIAGRVHAVIAAGLENPQLLALWRQEPNQLRDFGVEPEALDLSALWKFAGLTAKVRHNGLRIFMPLTFRLLNVAGLEIEVFASYASFVSSQGGRYADTSEKRAQDLLLFLEQWLDFDKREHALLWDLIRYELALLTLSMTASAERMQYDHHGRDARATQRNDHGRDARATQRNDHGRDARATQRNDHGRDGRAAQRNDHGRDARAAQRNDHGRDARATSVPSACGQIVLHEMSCDPRVVGAMLQEKSPRLEQFPASTCYFGFWRADASAQVQILELDDLGFYLLSFIDGERSAADLNRLLGGSKENMKGFLAALSELAAVGIIECRHRTKKKK